MSNLSNLGIVHTLISLVALAAGAWSLRSNGEISTRSPLGRLYLTATVVTAGTALALFRHGGPGPGHAIAVLTLLAVVVGVVAARRQATKRATYVATIALSATFFFHVLTGLTETLTRLPMNSPVFASQQAGGLKVVHLGLLLVFALGVRLQLRRAAARLAS